MITKNEAADIGGRAGVRRLGRRDHRRRLRAAPTTPSRSRDSYTDARRRPRRGRVTSTQKNYAASLASHDWILSLDADELRDARSWPARSSACWRPDPAARRLFGSPRVTWHLGRWVRTTDWYPDYQTAALRSARRGMDRPARARIGDGAGTASAAAASSAAAFRLSRHRRSSGNDRSLHHLRGASDARAGRRAGFADIGAPPAASRFFATTSRTAASATAIPGLVISALNSYYVFLKFAKLWEMNRMNPER